MRTVPVLSILTAASLALFAMFLWQRPDPHKESLGEVKSSDPASRPNFELPGAAVASAASSEWAVRQAAREGRSDMQSIVETFKEAGNCLQYFVALREKALIEDDALNDSAATEDDTGTSLRKTQEILDQTAAFCAGSDEETVARAYMLSVFDAAKRGNFDAQSCFVITGSVIPSPKIMLSGRYAEFLEARYLANAAAFTQSALERGDPYVAKNALYRYLETPPAHASKRGALPLPDPNFTLRSAHLAALRALPEQGASLETSIATFEELDLLPGYQVASAREWAAGTFFRDFSSAPALDLELFTPCHSLK